MSRATYLDLARRGLAMPIGTDLVLHDHPDPEAIRRDGEALGRVVVESARRWQTSLAIPLMDLRLEKWDLLSHFDVPEAKRDRFHFAEVPAEDAIERLHEAQERAFPAENQAQQEAIRVVASQRDLIAAGMVIGPFSLATKLMDDPIPAIALAGTGVEADEEPGVLLFERCLELAVLTVTRSVRAQLRAGAQAILVCEPAASTAYLSPRKLRGEGDAFDRFVIRVHRGLKQLTEASGADYLFHDCGDMVPEMVRRLGEGLHPTLLSVGSSRPLWEVAPLVPGDVVLFGNLPTRQFYSDAAMPEDRVAELSRELQVRMGETGHPFIFGSECDVLHVDGAGDTIRHKVAVMLQCAREVLVST